MPVTNQPTINRQVLLRRRPTPAVTADLFEAGDGPVPDPGPGELLIRVLWLSLDPAMRGWIAEAANYSDPVPIGGVMTGFTVGEVIASDHPDYAVGSFVQGRQGWQQYAVSDGADIDRVVDPGEAPLRAALHVLGMNAATAYVGLLDVCDPRPGETVLVTTAAGSVGSAVGQLAKIRGCRAVGICGSADKVAACLDDFGFDAAIDYKAAGNESVDGLAAAVAAACPDGVDCFFDNVGGAQFDAVLRHITVGARIAVCGTIGMPSFPVPDGPRVNRTLLVKRARMEGFLILDHYDRYEAIIADLSRWYREGRLAAREELNEGLDSAPDALVRLLAGENRGKMLVRVGEEP